MGQRGKQILVYLAKGKSATETANELCIAKPTVETHLKSIKQRLNTNSYFELCEYAWAIDLLWFKKSPLLGIDNPIN